MKLRIMASLVFMGFVVSGCSNQQNQGSATTYTTVNQKAAAQQAQGAVQQAQATADQSQQDVKSAASTLAEKIQHLLAQAKQYFDSGKYNDAITAAQNILGIDPNNIDAQKLIESAKEKIKALATQKIADVKSGFMNKLGQ